jgi:class 3 adenylate cyclase
VELPRIRYTLSHDGLSLAYYVIGRGDRDLVFINGSANHLELTWEIPGFRAVFTRLAAVGRLAVFDKRGQGLSDRDLGVGTLDDRMDDVRSVMDAAGFGRASLIGVSEGVPMAVLFAATYPDRVERLVLYGGFAYGGGPDADLDAVRVVDASWGTGSFVRLAIANCPNDQALLQRFERNVATPRGMREFTRRNALIDVRPILPDVRVPTLVVHDRHDPLVSFAAGRQLARHIPDATLVDLDNGYHWGWGEHDNDAAIDEFVSFISGERVTTDDVSERVLATVLFTDIVDSTELAIASGDHRWRSVLDRYHSGGRDAVDRHRGHWVKSTGDGILAYFDGPTRAVICAREIRQLGLELGLTTRSGLHTGEVETHAGDVAGVAVHMAARIVAVATPGEIWVSATIPGLVVGSSLSFDSRGCHTLKGLADGVDILAAR